MKEFFFVILFLAYSFATFADDPTQGKPFFPWLWNDQFKPTLISSVDNTGLLIAGSGLASTFAVQRFDRKIAAYNEVHPILMSEEDAVMFGKLGNGSLGVGIALAQILFDQKNGLRHGRALALTYITHWSSAFLIRRDRPDNRKSYLPFPSSCPSGHASQAFATAGSLAYSYGWRVGVPAYAVASAIAIARVREERHWASDIVAGAFLGSFWARASFQADQDKETALSVFPSPFEDGLMVNAVKTF